MIDKNIKNIIFDLGGVLLNIDYKAPIATFEKMGISGFDSFYSQAKQNDLFDRFETGEISPQEFRNEIKKHTAQQVSNQQIDLAWNSLLLDLPPARIELLRSLKNKYSIYLLSNTNEIHVAEFEKNLIQEFGTNPFNEIFIKHYYSCRMGKRKPNTDCFLQVINENNLVPEETLFIDDSQQHIEGAKKTGLHTVHLQGELLNLFN